MIYLFIFLLLLFCSYNYDVLNSQIGKNFTYVIICFVLIATATFRYRVGGDTLNYIWFHDYIPDFFNIDFFNKIDGVKSEIGWRFISSFAKIISDDFYWVQFIQSTFVNISLFVFFKRHSKYYFTCVLFYYIFFYLYLNFEILRESIAISIFLLIGLKYLLQKRYLYYTLTVLVAMLFHTSAFILFLMPFLLTFSSKKYNYFYWCTAIYFFGTILSPIFYDFLKSGIGISFLSDKFEVYLEYNFTLYGKIMAYFLYIVFPLVIYRYTKEYDVQLSRFLIIYAILGALTSIFTIFFRFINYLTPILILQLTMLFIIILRNKKDQFSFQHSLFYLTFIIVFSNLKIFTLVDTEYNIRWYSYWYPYYSIFEEKEDPDREYLWQKQFERQ